MAATDEGSHASDAPGSGSGAGSGSPGSARTPTVFVTDAAAESSRIADTLRTAGYAVIDVPLSMLVSRAQVQRPNVVLVDVDAPSALEEIARLRRQPGGGAVDFVYFGSGEGTIRSTEAAIANEGSAFFARPVDVVALIRRVESLTGGPIARPEARPSTPPPSIPQNTKRGSVPPDRPSQSLPAPGLRTPGPPLPMSTPSLADLVDPPRSLATFGTVSSELQQLLADAELRAEILPHADAPMPTPEEEIETVLPADVLASLDEPIEGDEDEEHEVRIGTGPGAERDAMGAHAKGTTAGGSKQTTASGRSASTSEASRNPGWDGRSPSSQPTPHTHERRVTGGDTSPRDLTPSRRTSEVPVQAHPHQHQHQHQHQHHQHQPSHSQSRRPSSIPPSTNQPPPPPRSVDPATIAFSGQTLDSATVALSQDRGDPGFSLSPTTQKWRPEHADTATVAITGPGQHGHDQRQQLPAPISMSDAPTRGPSDTPEKWRPSPEGAPARSPVAGMVILHPIDARHFLAEAIARRMSGALCFEHERIVRRLVLRDGDLVTAASGADRESLVCFLGARGELPRDEVERLAGKVPPYGRHAGAALVAHGWLGQDQLWNVLRAHAEWIATRVLRLGGGTAQLEAEPPGRLRSEPSVFAASTGAEIFVELVRRAVSPNEAIECLGGEASRIGDGPAQSLLSECALPPADLEIVSRSRGGTLGDLLARASEPDIASVVHALALLGILDILRAPPPSRSAALTNDQGGERGSSGASSADMESAALDDEAVRARIRARLELVDEGDYFSLLGVSRDATSYEVRRAFVELRRTFEPTRILSPRLSDLADDVRKIVVVLEEAYEILRDVARRERYRKAIDGRPS